MERSTDSVKWGATDKWPWRRLQKVTTTATTKTIIFALWKQNFKPLPLRTQAIAFNKISQLGGSPVIHIG